MKKNVPNITKIEFPYEPSVFEELQLWRFSRIIEEGHAFSKKDFDLFCAILIRKFSLENLSEDLQEQIIIDGKIKPSIQFLMTALAIEQDEEIDDKELEQHAIERLKNAIERKKIVMKEIARTGINPSKINLDNSEYYRTLLNQVKDFDDLTLIDWFVPIVLTFERFVHIYVKHIEETKFAKGQFKKRTFFDYNHNELLTLIKKVIRQEEKSIKEHFLEVRMGLILNESEKVKDYHRGIKNHPPINLNGDKFKMTIDKTGKIMTFHQL